MKYVDTAVTFAEFPDEVALCINISNCPCHCPGCHSSYLAQDVGGILDKESLYKLIDKNTGITCVGLMGGDADTDTINQFAKCIKEDYPNLKVGWYSGRQELSKAINIAYFDYIKLGPYIEEYGPLNNRNTNQRMYMYNHPKPGTIAQDWYSMDITYKFWK